MPISEVLLDKIKANTFQETILDLRPFENGDVLDDQDIIKLADALKYNQYIKKLDLSYNNIGDEGAKAIAKIETLKELNLSNGLDGYSEYANNITAEGSIALAHSKLEILDLHGNPIGDRGLEALASNKTILDLNVSDCEITSTGATKLFRNNKKIRRLNLKLNSIKDDGLITIGENKILEVLELSDCDITAIGANWLSTNTSLKRLQLSGNNLGNDGARALSKHVTLEFLGLGACGIRDEGIAAFRDNSHIQELVLSHNQITAEGVRQLSGNNTLTHLYLEYNHIHFDETSLQTLINIPSLNVLSAENNQVSTELSERMEAICMRHKSLQTADLTVHGNNIDKTILVRYRSKRKFEEISDNSQSDSILTKTAAINVAKKSL